LPPCWKPFREKRNRKNEEEKSFSPAPPVRHARCYAGSGGAVKGKALRAATRP
jgi:hypothetical protein